MILSFGDWLIVVLYFVLSIAIGVMATGRAGKSLAEYFVSGRSLPWWLAGTSMVATTFAADTPLVVAGLVGKYGVAGNWLWWNAALSGVLTVFFFARLWRRAGVMTDAEFAELRYGGKPAAFLRGFRALYLALPVNLIIMGWVTAAMVKVLQFTTGIPPMKGALLLFAITAAYSMLSGLWGVILTDAFQFVLAMAGSIILACIAVDAVGGLDLLVSGATAHFGSTQAAVSVLPPLDGAWLPISSVFVFLGMQWWASWYPGAEPGGGGYIVQRILSTKDERHGLLATLWFNIAHYALRPWPWIIVGLYAVVRYPGLANPEDGYVQAMRDLLPSPLRGLMLAAFAAAYMSTIATHLNWGASYLVSDVWLRFVRKNASNREQVLVSRLASAALMLLTIPVVLGLTSVVQGWQILFTFGAGTGAVLILRWYWWRVSAWSEIFAMVASLVTTLVLSYTSLGGASETTDSYAIKMVITVGVTTAAWIIGTLLTPPESEAVLERFYRKVRPGGPGWRRVAERLGYGAEPIPGGALSWVNWVAGWLAIYTALFGVGQLLVGTATLGLVLLAGAAALFALIARNLRSDAAFQAGGVDSA